MPTHPDQTAAMQFLRECIDAHGVDRGPAVARVRYAHIPPATWSRWLKAVRSEALMSFAPAAPGASATAPVPTMPKPQLGASPASFRDQLQLVVDSCDAMLTRGWVPDASGTKQVRNPMLISQSGRLRVQAMDTLAKHLRALNSAEALRDRHDEWQTMVVDIVSSFIKSLAPADQNAAAEQFVAELEEGHHQTQIASGLPGLRTRRSPLYVPYRWVRLLPRKRPGRLVSPEFCAAQQARLDAGTATYAELMAEEEPRLLPPTTATTDPEITK